MVDVYLKIDKVELRAQTHCTLTAARGMIRMYYKTGDKKYLEGAKSIMELYVNGTLVGSLSLTADMVMPVFTGGRTPAICIGACTDSTDGARNGFAGSIAVCNIFADPITADEAKALYEASK